MKTYVKKSSDNQHQTVAHAVTQQQNRANVNAQFIDNRAETFGLRQLQRMIDGSPRTLGLAQLRTMMSGGSRSALIQNLQVRVNNSPHQVVQRRLHSRVQGASIVAPSDFSGMKHISKPLVRVAQLTNFPKDSIGTINKKWSFEGEKGKKVEVSGTYLQEKILNIAKSFEQDPTSFRLGSYTYQRDGALNTLSHRPGGDYEENHGMRMIPEAALKNTSQIEKMDNLIKLYIRGTLTDAGQMQYITDNANEIFNTHIVVIDVDCQFDRRGDVAFHKDSRGTTVFFNLTFNNTKKMQGTDYYEDLEGDSGLEEQLPKEVKNDILERRNNYKEDNDIKSPELEPFGRISSSDPNLYHSTPLMRSRKKPTGEETREFLINYILLKQAKKNIASIIIFLKNFTRENRQFDFDNVVREAIHYMDKFTKKMDSYLPGLGNGEGDMNYLESKFSLFLKYIKDITDIKKSENEDLRDVANLEKSHVFLDKATFEKEKDEALRDKYEYYLEYDYHSHGRDKKSSMSDDDLHKKAIETAKRKRQLDSRLKDGSLTQADLDKQKEKPRTFIRTWVRFVPKS